MLILGHVGFTLGAAVLLDSVISRNYHHITTQNNAGERTQSSSESVVVQSRTPSTNTSVLMSLANHIDIRILLIGALLPDIIDKPIGLYFLRDSFSTGRIYCHTLLFSILLVLAGLYLYKRSKKLWLLVLSFVTLTHLILDQMWLHPRTLLWPLYGFTFERGDPAGWAIRMLRALISDPGIYLPEIVGGVILIWFAWVLVRNRTIYAFIVSGIV